MTTIEKVGNRAPFAAIYASIANEWMNTSKSATLVYVTQNCGVNLSR